MLKFSRIITTLVTALILTACGNTLARLEQVGKTPPFEEVVHPAMRSDYRPVAWPKTMEDEKQSNAIIGKNSLWQANANSFFSKQKSRKIGDIIKVVVRVDDSADFDNTTTRSREGADNVNKPTALGLENKFLKLIPGEAIADKLLEFTGSRESSGTGTISRSETIETEIAAMVTQTLPNGNLVIHGRQEVRVNFELREVTVSGIVRPQDISSTNSVTLDQIAEARVSYGGRGHITDYQQPSYGRQIIDLISPF